MFKPLALFGKEGAAAAAGVFSVVTANPVRLLASPFGRGVTPWRDGEGNPPAIICLKK
ncbi:MAG: hypothetical protein FWH14_00245 [Oscillospiraceae bacterium]|nr:hypothetical protein [Oscillospiraceae bacterium]